jgi:DNA-binding transcriptional ArsR family regulator
MKNSNYHEEPSYYATIPAPVRYDESLSSSAKLFYGELTALSKKLGYCWATNQYFVDLYKVDKDTISRWISQLTDAGHIEVSIDKKKGNSRTIRIGVTARKKIPRRKKEDTSPQECGDPSELILSGENGVNSICNSKSNNKEYKLVSIVPGGTSIFSTGDNILVTIGEYEDGNQLAIIEEAPKLPEKQKSAGALLNEALALFQTTFPGDFIGKQTAFSKPPTREAVQALLDRIGVDGIKLLLDKYNRKKLEKFCPLAGTVYEFCTFKLAKIEAYVYKDGGLYAQKSISSLEHRTDLERKIAAKFEAAREADRKSLKKWLETHPDDGIKLH